VPVDTRGAMSSRRAVKLRYRLAGNRRIRLAGFPDGRWHRCDQAGRCEIVKDGEAFTEEVAR
jgi:hypothetical protein